MHMFNGRPEGTKPLLLKKGRRFDAIAKLHRREGGRGLQFLREDQVRLSERGYA